MTRAYEAICEEGVIRLANGMTLPDHTRVVVLAQVGMDAAVFRISSPRLVNRAQAADFVKEVVEESADATLR
jgi:hypothetical protein